MPMLNSELSKLENSLSEIGGGKIVEVSKSDVNEVNRLKNFYKNNYYIVGPAKDNNGNWSIAFVYKKNYGVKNA